MGRHGYFNLKIDELRNIDMKFLREHGYLKGNQEGVISWFRGSEKVAAIRVKMFNRSRVKKEMILTYVINGEKNIKLNIDLEPVQSNLGKGLLWYFNCPITDRRCRKLYLYDGYFVSRFALPKMQYESQGFAKSDRGMIRSFKEDFEADKLYEELYSPYFKTHYRGKPTRRYLEIIRKLGSRF